MTLLSSRRGPFLAAALVILLGCQAETFGADDIVVDPAGFEVVGGAPVPGGHLIVTAPWMAELPNRITLAIDDRTPTLAIRADPSAPARFFLPLPIELTAGPHQLALHSSGAAGVAIGSFSSGGFTAFRIIENDLYAPAQPTPNFPGLIGMSFTGGGSCGYSTMVLNARTGTMSSLPNASTCGYGVGASYRPGFFTIYQPWSGGSWLRVGLSISGAVVDSIEMSGNWWPGHELAPGLYLKDQKQTSWLQDTSTVNYWEDLGQYTHPEYIAFSPDGHWAVSSHSYSANGLLIVDRNARTYHWATGWEYASGAFFLPDGRLLAYGSRGPYDPGGLVSWYLGHVDPVSGGTTDSVFVGSARTWEGMFSLPTRMESNGWVVLARNASGRIELSIRDPETLAEIARPVGPEVPSDCLYYADFKVIEDPQLHSFYVIGTDCNATTPIWTFKLPE